MSLFVIITLFRPGHVDFTIEVERSARVLDGSVIIVDAVSGVQAQTQTVWKQVQKQHIPSIAFVNKMDRDGASFQRTIASLRSKLGANAVPIQLPVGAEETFSGVIDLISMRQFDWGVGAGTGSRSPVVQQLSADGAHYESALAQRTQLLESIAELDEPFMEKYLEATAEQPLSTGDVLDALRRVCLQGALVPVLSGASLRGKGVEPLLDSILAFLPSPLDNRPFRAVHKDSAAVKELSAQSPELCALAFKVTHDAARGPLVFARVFSGSINAKHSLFNASQGRKERINQLLQVSADDLATMPQCGPGEVCCIVGLKHTSTGDTLVTDGGPLSKYVLDGLTVPPPVFALAVEPERTSQQDELEEALRIMCTEDPSLKLDVNAESGQTMIRGIGELHLEIVIDRLKRQFNLEVTTGKAYVAYREGIEARRRSFERRFTYDRMLGPKRMYAVLTFDVRASGVIADPIVVIDKPVKTALTADEFIGLHDGLQAALARGPRGFPVVGIEVTVTAVEKDADTSVGSLRACAALFVNDLLTGNDRLLLEPVMSVEVELPERFVGDVLSDLTVQRRAQIKEITTGGAVDSSNSKHVIFAQVPLAAMLGYATTLRSMTQGEGSFSAEYSTHLPVDPSIADL